jgi:hypothetical protein
VARLAIEAGGVNATRRIPPIVWVMAAVAVFRLSLLGRGAMAFLDETMYYKAGLALDALHHGKIAGALAHIAFNNGRPGNALLQLVPAALQAIPFSFGVATSNPLSLLIPLFCNLLVSLLGLWLFWRIALQLFEGDRVAAVLATGVYGLLVNSNLYIRHLLACEPSLCLGLLALWLALTQPLSRRVAVGVGAISAFAFTVYPGYYAFLATPLVALTAREDAGRSMARLADAALFAAGGGAVLIAMELLCRGGNIPYFASLRGLSGTISQGSFDEGWTFFPRYLVQIERAAGVVLLCGIVLFTARLATDVARRNRLRLIHWLVLAATAGWLWQAIASSVMQTMVLYGRLLHPWMAFLVWATIDAIRSIRGATIRKSMYVVTASASLVSWALFARQYVPLVYPADVLYDLRIDTTKLASSQRRCDMPFWHWYEAPGPIDRQTRAPLVNRPDVMLINFCQGAPSAEKRPAAPACEPELFRAPHFMAFPAYGFEGLAPEQRVEITRPEYDLRVCGGQGG